jgi:EmrB/QacA subfamily drug resistance transporter
MSEGRLAAPPESKPELAPTATERSGAHPWWTLASVSVGLIMVGIDATVVAIANPVIGRDLHTSLAQLQWVTNAYLLVLAVGLVFGGKLGDRYGRRAMFLTGVVGFALSSLAVGLVGGDVTGSIGGVIAFRALQGAFGALLMPNTLAILRATFPTEKLNMAVGIWGGASAVSVALGPIVGGLLVQDVSWESAFYINLPVAAVALLIGVPVLRESRDERPERFDLAGVAMLGVSLFLVVFGFIKAETWGWGSARTVGFLTGGVVLLAAFAVVELRTRTPLLPVRLFANRSLSVSTVVVLVGFLALFGVLFFLTLYLENVHGFSAVEAGVRMLPLSATMMLAAPLGGVLTEKLGPRFTMAAGLALIGAGLLWMTGVQAESGYGTLWPPFVCIGIGIGFMITSSSEAIVGNAPVGDAGVAGGIQSTATQLGGVIGTAILGSVLTTQVGASLVGKLVGAGTPAPVAHQLKAAGVAQLVGQGLAPAIPHAPAQLQAAITAGSHLAFMSGLHTALVVAALVAFVAALLALTVRRGRGTSAGRPVAL